VNRLNRRDTVEVAAEELFASLLKPSPKSGRPPVDAESDIAPTLGKSDAVKD